MAAAIVAFIVEDF